MSAVHPRSPSPPQPSAEFERETDNNWSDDSRKAFHAMVIAPAYVNRYRLSLKKRESLMHYLEHPDEDPMNSNGSKDHQTKYQAANWTIVDSKLYRKPERGRVGKLRRHLDEFETWHVLTTEHLRLAHLGRDKLRKELEKRYIGYNLQEIMFVLKNCKKCAGREKPVNREEARQDRDTTSEDRPHEDGCFCVDISEPSQSPKGPSAPPSAEPKGPFRRKQTSNFMWF